MSDQSTPDPAPSTPVQPAATGATRMAPVPRAGGGPRRWWDDATSTGAGRAALAAVAVLTALFVVAGIGLATAVVLANHRAGDRGFVTSTRDGMGPGRGLGLHKGNGNGNGLGNDKNKKKNRDEDGQDRDEQAPGPGNPNTPNGRGLGQGKPRGAGAGAALGAVLHGEFTTNLTGTPTVMVVQTGQVTAYTAGKSLTVKSTDGFAATYTLDAGTAATLRNPAALVTGVQVRVVAAKAGMKVTALDVG